MGSGKTAAFPVNVDTARHAFPVRRIISMCLAYGKFVFTTVHHLVLLRCESEGARV